MLHLNRLAVFITGDPMKAVALFCCLIVLSAMLWSARASAACECYCVDGALRTLCSGVDEAQQGVTLCTDRAASLCPVPDPAASQTYDPPQEDAENCRDASVWDPSTTEFRTLKICDVKDAG